MMDNLMIKQELLQYIARLIETHPLQSSDEPRAARHDVAALLVQQALELGCDDVHYDMLITKPILKGALYLIKDRIGLLENQTNNKALCQLREEYLQTTNTLERILENLNN